MKLFVLLIVAGGAGGFAGSVVGGAFGKTGLFIGGFVGGLITTPVGAFLATRLKWLEPSATSATAIGATIGFIAAAIITINTLSTPVGALFSPLLVGIGGVASRSMRRRCSF